MPQSSYDTSVVLDFLIFKFEDNKLRHRVPLRPDEILDPKHLNTVCDKEQRLNIIHINNNNNTERRRLSDERNGLIYRILLKTEIWRCF